MEKLIKSYNALVPIMNKLSEEGHDDIWEHHDSMMGYGFQLIEEKIWIQVSISAYIDEDNRYYITKFERNGNVFCPYSNKRLKEKMTTNPKEIYSIIKEMLDND